MYQSELKDNDLDEPMDQQFTRIVQDFDSAQVCPGISDDKFSKIKFCAGGVFEGGVWRSSRCPLVHSSGKINCPECCVLKRALGRLASKPPPPSQEETIAKLRADLKLAQQKIGRNSAKLEVNRKVFKVLIYPK